MASLKTRRMARNESFAGRLTAGLGMERDDDGNQRQQAEDFFAKVFARATVPPKVDDG
jgi:hypothetical protein